MNGSVQLNMPVVPSAISKKGLAEGSQTTSAEIASGSMSFAALFAGLTVNGQMGTDPLGNAGDKLVLFQGGSVLSAGLLPEQVPGLSAIFQQVLVQGKGSILGETGLAAPLMADNAQVMVSGLEDDLNGLGKQAVSNAFGNEIGKLVGDSLQQEVKALLRTTENPISNPLGQQLTMVDLPDTPGRGEGLPIFEVNSLDNFKVQDNTQNGQLNLNLSQPGETMSANSSSVKQAALPETAFPSVVSQLIQSSKAIISRGKSEVEIQLKPEYLGKVQMRVALEEGILTAKFLVESQAVGRLLENNLNQLRQSLQEQGLKFGQVNVEIGSGGFAQNPGQNFDQAKQRFARSIEPLENRQEEPVKKLSSLNGVNFLA